MTHETNYPAITPSAARGRGLFWAALGVCALGIALVVAQYSVKRLIVPWYLPALTTLGAGLMLWSLGQRRTIVRNVGLVLLAALAGLQWFVVGTATRLPEYEGPAQAGASLPDFETKLADGRPFTQRNLRDGTNSVLVFFRGRW